MVTMDERLFAGNQCAVATKFSYSVMSHVQCGLNNIFNRFRGRNSLLNFITKFSVCNALSKTQLCIRYFAIHNNYETLTESRIWLMICLQVVFFFLFSFRQYADAATVLSLLAHSLSLFASFAVRVFLSLLFAFPLFQYIANGSFGINLLQT